MKVTLNYGSCRGGCRGGWRTAVDLFERDVGRAIVTKPLHATVNCLPDLYALSPFSLPLTMAPLLNRISEKLFESPFLSSQSTHIPVNSFFTIPCCNIHAFFVYAWYIQAPQNLPSSSAFSRPLTPSPPPRSRSLDDWAWARAVSHARKAQLHSGLVVSVSCRLLVSRTAVWC